MDSETWDLSPTHHSLTPQRPSAFTGVCSREPGTLPPRQHIIPGPLCHPQGGAEPAGQCHPQCCPRPRSCRSPWCTGHCASRTSARSWVQGAAGFLNRDPHVNLSLILKTEQFKTKDPNQGENQAQRVNRLSSPSHPRYSAQNTQKSESAGGHHGVGGVGGWRSPDSPPWGHMVALWGFCFSSSFVGEALIKDSCLHAGGRF